MNYKARLGIAALVIGSLGGCGGNDFSGSYGAEGPYGKNVVLNITGDAAKIYLADKATSKIGGIHDFKVSYKDEKMLLDETKSNERIVFKRNVDERGLDCLNCRDFGMAIKWVLVSPKPYDVDSMLKKQRETEQTKQKATLELINFAGVWVLKRQYKEDPLEVLSVTIDGDIKQSNFNYSTAGKMIELHHSYKIEDNVLKLLRQDNSTNYVKSDDGGKLSCVNCKPEHYFVRANAMKVDDINYTRALAGDPQESRK